MTIEAAEVPKLSEEKRLDLYFESLANFLLSVGKENEKNIKTKLFIKNEYGKKRLTTNK
jgi:hypothetical protein